MAQPTQVFSTGSTNVYTVIDNGAAGASITTSTGSSIWSPLDATQTGKDFDFITTGAVAQGKNAFTNGTIPAFLVPAGPVIPGVVQKISNSSTGSVATLVKAYASNNAAGNTLIVVCGVGNGTAPTITDSQTNTYTSVVQIANSTAFNVAIFIAPNSKAGANTVTVNNGGTTASIAMEIYEISGMLQVTTSDSNASGTVTGTTSPAIVLAPSQVNDFSFVAFGLGTAAQTITVGASYNNDSGQLNPTTPAGLFSFVAASLILTTAASSSPTATATSEPWAVAAAAFKSVSPSSTALGISTAGVYLKNPA